MWPRRLTADPRELRRALQPARVISQRRQSRENRFVRGRLELRRTAENPEIPPPRLAHHCPAILVVEHDEVVIALERPEEGDLQAGVRFRIDHACDASNRAFPPLKAAHATSIHDLDFAVVPQRVLGGRGHAISLKPRRIARDLVPLPHVPFQVDVIPDLQRPPADTPRQRPQQQ